MRSALSALVALAALTEAVPQGGGGGRATMLRFGCSQVVVDRLDPIVNPGQMPSAHEHQVGGGNAFNATMASTDISKLATCTTCSYAEDFSNYWTANMYFKAKNGTFKRVPQVPNRLLFGDQYTTKITGGFVVYYVSAGKGTVTAFKPGFRMVVGDASQKAASSGRPKTQTCYRCYTGPNYGGDNAAPCADARLDTLELPKKKCSGIRSNILYPTCWDGKNLDSPDHKSHVTYPNNGPATFTGSSTGGACPSTHPVKIPQIMLEIVWDTSIFNNEDWGSDQPFWLSTGDNTGYSQHADYVFGWKDDSLQRAMDAGCTGASCSNLKTQSNADGAKCQVPSRIKENYEGWLHTLPGMSAM